MFQQPINDHTTHLSHKTAPRRLALQHLEARLALSAVTMFDVTHSISGRNHVDSGGFIALDSTSLLAMQDKSILQVDYGVLFLDSDGSQANAIDDDFVNEWSIATIPVPAPHIPGPPGTSPTGGPIDIPIEGPNADPPGESPPATEGPSSTKYSEHSPAADYSLTLTDLNTQQVRWTRTSTAAANHLRVDNASIITPSRSRAVAFRVAAVAPPSSILAAPRQQTTHPVVADGIDRDVELSTAKVDHGSQQDSDKPASNHQSLSGTALQNWNSENGLTATSNDSPVNDLNVSSSSPSNEAARQTVSHTTDNSDQADEAVHQQVFADWRKREFVAIPVVAALTAGAILHRHRKKSVIHTVQLPPNRDLKVQT